VQTDPLAKIRENLELTFHRFCYDTPRAEGSYVGWSQVHDTIGDADVAAMQTVAAGWENPPHINIVMPTFNTPRAFLDQAIESVLGQAYTNWSLLIADDCSTDDDLIAAIERWANQDPRISFTLRSENGHICRASNSALEMATKGWVVFLDHDDKLTPHALWMIAREIVAHPEAEFIYSDSDKLTEDGTRANPYFAPDFNYELLLASNYVTHLAAYRLEGVNAIGGLRPGYEGSQDWDLVLRYLTERCGTPPNRQLVRHIPNVLYHWRMSPTSTAANMGAKPYALEAGRRAVLDHLQATGQGGAFVGPNPQAPICPMIRFMVTDPAPLVSIIIPTKDNDKVLGRCLGSLLQRSLYPNYEVLIVDNGSKEPATLRLLTEAQKDARVRVLRRPGPFNYSAMNNFAVCEAKGEFVCLLNDDTEIVEPAWLNDLVGLASRKGVGAVGAKLLYPNGTVQQNGIMIDWNARPGGKCMHTFQQLPGGHPGQANRNLITQEWTAITGACMVVKRSLYLEMGGLDEEVFPVDYNDVDFCLRLYTEGYRNLTSAQAIVFHHEGATKKKHLKEHAFARVVADEGRLVERHGHVFDGQWNRNLMFHPHLDKAAMPGPAKPWSVERQRVLIINGTVNEAMQAWKDGQLPFCATLDGHSLHMTYPQMAHVKPIDVRGPIDPFLEVLGALDIPRLVFCGVGNGTIGAIGYMAAIAEAGWPIEYRPTPAAEFRDPYVSHDAWTLMFSRLRNAQERAAEMIADGSPAAGVENAAD
jgi:O-antigen biosynthesis protein